MKKKLTFITLLFACIVSSCKDNPVRVLILSGNNNHDWQETTPMLEKILTRKENFTVYITEKPDTINASMLKQYDVVVSNWNAYPELTRLWNSEAKQALLEFVKRGGGYVCIHAASATHYDWPPYLEITGGRWGDKTHHGAIDNCAVQIINQEHPITKGLHNFTIRDELWVDLECSPAVEVLCAAQAEEYKNTPEKLEPVAMITRYGKGRGYYFVLGHDTSTMSHPDWQTLLIRGTGWVAGKTRLSN